ncbi:stage II sporulation protein P [Desulfofalx alkaliphila]|uniref:stage II sporulation protein P n=1 Tax=Desulfofalx alkaliphila TaxID=105483 RepID=UPI0006913CC1|nr:stage II sporulation protein P [Desulfofalx alkaliphila]
MNYSRAVRHYRIQLILKRVRTYLYWLLVLALLLLLLINPHRSTVAGLLANLAGKCTGAVVAIFADNPQNLMAAVMPAMAWADESAVRSGPEMIMLALGTITRVDMHNPQNLIQSQIPFFTDTNTQQPEEGLRLIVPPDDERDKNARDHLEGPALVAIYNTHTGETYALTDGVERLNGKRGAVVQVAEVLEEQLNKHGIGVVRSDTVHDAEYNRSYIESEKTVQKFLEEHENLQLLLDIHRDAARPRSDSYIEIKGEKVARIMFVVGSDARMPFPNWQQNLAAARQVESKMEEMYPGLSLGIRVKEGRYNQHYHPGAMLIEVGTVENTTEEALRAAKLLGDILARVLKEDNFQNMHTESFKSTSY